MALFLLGACTLLGSALASEEASEEYGAASPYTSNYGGMNQQRYYGNYYNQPTTLSSGYYGNYGRNNYYGSRKKKSDGYGSYDDDNSWGKGSRSQGKTMELDFDAKVKLYRYPNMAATIPTIEGDVYLHFNKYDGVDFFYGLNNVDQECSPPTQSGSIIGNSCGIHLHHYNTTGGAEPSCADENQDKIGDHYYNQAVSDDPWGTNAVYQVIPETSTGTTRYTAKAEGYLTIYNGYSEKQTMMDGAVLVINNHAGDRVACGILYALSSSSSAYGSSKKSSSWSSHDSYDKSSSWSSHDSYDDAYSYGDSYSYGHGRQNSWYGSGGYSGGGGYNGNSWYGSGGYSGGGGYHGNSGYSDGYGNAGYSGGYGNTGYSGGYGNSGYSGGGRSGNFGNSWNGGGTSTYQRGYGR